LGTELGSLLVPEIPEGFPSRLTDEELVAVLNEWIRAYGELYGDLTRQLTDLKLTLIGAGLQEQSRREFAASARS
jgi:hypothetical protein